MFAAINVSRHDVIIGPVKKQLSQELDGLPFGDVTVGLHENVIVSVEEHVEVDGQVAGYDFFVPSQDFLRYVRNALCSAAVGHCTSAYSESSKGIGSNLKRALVDPLKEAPEDTIARLLPIFIDASDALGA